MTTAIREGRTIDVELGLDFEAAVAEALPVLRRKRRDYGRILILDGLVQVMGRRRAILGRIRQATPQEQLYSYRSP